MAEQKKRWRFDVEVDPVLDGCRSMEQLMQTYRLAWQAGDRQSAAKLLDYAATSGYLPAKLALARLLRTTPLPGVSQQRRYAQAEALCLELLNLLDLSDDAIAAVCLELAQLYQDCLNRPVGSLAAMLTAKRHGADISDTEISLCRQRLSKTDVNALGTNPRDAYRLGKELFLSGTAQRMAELFLREAEQTEDPCLKGMVCLTLADFYTAHRHESTTYADEALRYAQLARELGFPEYLVKEGLRNATAA